MDCRSLPPLSVDGASVRHRARFPASPLKFRTSGFPTVRLQTATPLATCPWHGAPPARGLLALSQGAALVDPDAHVPVKRARVCPGRAMVCCHVRVAPSTTVAKGSESPAGLPSPPWTVHGPLLGPGYVVPAFIVTTARCARLRPTSRLRALRLYARPCRSRALPAGAESFLALPVVPSDRAVPRTPQGPRAAYAHSSPGDIVFARFFGARRPECSANPLRAVQVYEAAGFA